MDPSIAIILMAASTGASNLFIYCYFGMLTTESYDQMGVGLYYDLCWPDMPVKLQKYLVIMIANMQIPIYYHGFEVAKLNLCTFVEVRKYSCL